ncbi:MAG: fused MFS/spermidine synthase [Desulfohalobiaceae bacterium]
MPDRSVALLTAVLMLGAVSQVGQVLFLRELLMVFHGNELSVGLILAAWLFWVGVGSRLGAFLAERIRNALSLLALSSAGLLPVLPGTVFLIRTLRGFFPILPGASLSPADMALACVLLLAPACLLLGTQFVALSRTWRERDEATDTSGAAKTYVVEAAGNMLGGVAFTFLLVHTFSSFHSAVLLGVLLLVAYSALVFRMRQGLGGPSQRSATVLLCLAGLAGLAMPYLGDLNQFAHRLQWRHIAPEHRLAEARQSRYGNIGVLEREGQYSFFQSGHLLFSTAEGEEGFPGLEEQPAAEFAHLAMVQQESPDSVLLVGGGLRGTLSRILKHPVQSVDYVELDEVLIRTAAEYLPQSTLRALEDSRVSVRHGDGRLWMKRTDREYDLIIVDVPDPVTAALNRYYTREFFREARKRLRPDGALVIGADSTPDLRDTAAANRNSALYHTLNSVFSRVKVAGEKFMLFFASRSQGGVSVDARTLGRRFERRGIEDEAFSSGHFRLLLRKPDVRRANWVVSSHGRGTGAHLDSPEPAPLSPGTLGEQAKRDLQRVNEAFFINRDFKPIGYFYSLMFWHRSTRAEPTKALAALLRVKLWWVLPIAGLILLAGAGMRGAGGRIAKGRTASFSLLVTVFSTGLSTMLLQIALLFTFQSVYGFVYEMVGLITALFMFGLGLGAAASNRFVADKADMSTLALVQLCMSLWAGLIALGLPQLAKAESPAFLFAAFSGMTFLAGMLNGLDFPLAAGCSQRIHRKPDKSAGAVYGLELFGACLGAVLASVVLAPVHGIVACCLLAGLGNGVACVLLLLSRRDYASLQTQKGSVEQAGFP